MTGDCHDALYCLLLAFNILLVCYDHCQASKSCGAIVIMCDGEIAILRKVNLKRVGKKLVHEKEATSNDFLWFCIEKATFEDWICCLFFFSYAS